MKIKKEKFLTMAVAAVVFMTMLFLNFEKNKKTGWKFIASSATAYNNGDETAPSKRTGSKSPLYSPTGSFIATGSYIIFKPAGTNPGAATVSPNSIIHITLYTKTIESSDVGFASPNIYNITYKATYTASTTNIASVDFLDGEQVTF